MPAKLCTHPCCKAIVRDGSHRCNLHRATKRSKEVIERSSFYNTTSWKKLSLSHRQQHPICELCQRELTSDCDHWSEISISPDDYKLDPRNLVSLCKSCHYIKGNKIKQYIRHEDWNGIYLYLLNQSPREENKQLLHNWIKSKRG
ncbi:HNH endonuclease [Vibrio parahaemolyticus]|uniref:HNH endonuclease n=1 Tax=Vibrio parahaemolyticus TaxID=670 RepID=UPI000AAA05F8